MGTEVWLVLLVMVLRLGARWLVALRRELATDIFSLVVWSHSTSEADY